MKCSLQIGSPCSESLLGFILYIIGNRKTLIVALIQSLVLVNIFSKFLRHTEKENFGVIIQPIFLILLLLSFFTLGGIRAN